MAAGFEEKVIQASKVSSPLTLPSRDPDLKATEILGIRTRLNLSVKEAGELTGVGETLFEQFESRKSVPSKQTQEFLQLLNTHPALMEVLKVSSGGKLQADAIATLGVAHALTAAEAKTLSQWRGRVS